MTYVFISFTPVFSDLCSEKPNTLHICVVQGKIQPVSLGGWMISVIFDGQVQVRNQGSQERRSPL